MSLPVQPPGLPTLLECNKLPGLLLPAAAGLLSLLLFDKGLAWRLLGCAGFSASAATNCELLPLLMAALGFTNRYRSAAWPASSRQAAEASSGRREGLPSPPPSTGARASARAVNEPSSWPRVAPAPSSPNSRPAASGLNTSAERAHCRQGGQGGSGGGPLKRKPMAKIKPMVISQRMKQLAALAALSLCPAGPRLDS